MICQDHTVSMGQNQQFNLGLLDPTGLLYNTHHGSWFTSNLPLQETPAELTSQTTTFCFHVIGAAVFHLPYPVWPPAR